MKRYHISIAKKEAIIVAQAMYELGCTTLVSWYEPPQFFDDPRLQIVYAVPEEKETDFTTTARKYGKIL